jgi:hypothetical protein
MKGNWFLVIAVVLFTCLVAYRAIVIPMTHDEASTWLNFRHFNLWSCVSNYYCWQSANNHWLNSILMQWSANLFGDGAIGLRLPNVLAGLLYFIAAACIAARYIHIPWLKVTGFLLLCSHVYLLDFFSLCRGYGLVSCGMIWGVYTLLRYNELFQFRWLVCCVVILFFSVLSNFTAILPFLSMGLVWLGVLLINKRYVLLLKHGFFWLLAFALLVMLLTYPFRIFRSEGELEWGSKNLWNLGLDLAGNLLYGFQYGFEHSASLLIYSFLILVSLVALFVLRSKRVDKKTPVLLAFCLLSINLLVVFLYHKFTGSSMPLGRKSVYLIPFIFTPLALGLGFIKHKKVGLLFGVFVSGLLLFHAVRPQNWRAVREWYYDAYYPELFSTILPTQPEQDSIRIGSSWIFYPALDYYQKAGNMPLSGLAYQRPIEINPTLDYYYVESTDSTGMRAQGFVLDRNIGPFFLFKKIVEKNMPVEIEK